jgi:hypothetical protein
MLRVQVSSRISILLEIGIVGYLISAVACMFLWLAFIGGSGGHDHFRRWLVLVYPLIAIGLMMEGLVIMPLESFTR